MVFLKTLRKSIFVDSCFFSYFQGFSEEPLNKNQYVRKLSLRYICRDFITSSYFFYKHTYAKTGNASFYINKTKFKPQATGQKSEIEVFNWVSLSTMP